MPVRIDFPSIQDIVSLLASGRISGSRLHEMLNESVNLLDDRVNSFAVTTGPERTKTGRSPLHNLPVSVKDIIDTKGIGTEYGSTIFAGHVPERDAAVVWSIRKNGGQIQGKTQTHEFAMGIVTPQSRNPWDVERTTGGSSGGSAAAVSAGFSLVSIGTDTAGSIRIPAAFCGVSGLKPSSGKISVKGIYPEAWSLDTVGPICRYASDIPFILRSMGYVQSGTKRSPIKIAAILTDLVDNSETSVRRIFSNFVDTISSEGILDVSEISIPEIEDISRKDDLIDSVENYSIQKELFIKYPKKFSRLSVEQMQYARDIRAHEYVAAQRIRRKFIKRIRGIYRHYGILLSPSAPTIAPLLRDIEKMPPSYFLKYMRHTNIFNFSKDPALSIPIGFSGGLPVGAQMSYIWGYDSELCNVAGQFQKISDHHLMFPEEFAARAEVIKEYIFG